VKRIPSGQGNEDPHLLATETSSGTQKILRRQNEGYRGKNWAGQEIYDARENTMLEPEPVKKMKIGSSDRQQEQKGATSTEPVVTRADLRGARWLTHPSCDHEHGKRSSYLRTAQAKHKAKWGETHKRKLEICSIKTELDSHTTTEVTTLPPSFGWKQKFSSWPTL
jgi:hypothetical protein